MKYEIIEHISDLGLRIYGNSFKELLENAGFALFEQMTDLSKVDTLDSIEILAGGETVEELFMSWLRELLYLFHVERYLLKEFEITVIEKGSVRARAKGEKMDMNRHVMDGEVKGVTYHRLEIKETSGRWEARLILDV